MRPKPLGTILPTREILAAGDKAADELARQRDEHGRLKLARFARRVVGRETRYYDGERYYAVVSPDLKILWFEIRPDGDYAMTRR